MTPTELRTALARLNLSQVGAAKMVGISDRTMRRYISGKYPIPAWLPLALAGMARQGAAEAREAPLTVSGPQTATEPLETHGKEI